MKRIIGIIMTSLFVMAGAGILLNISEVPQKPALNASSLDSPTAEIPTLASPNLQSLDELLQDPLPVYNWHVCGDLGIGFVPGIGMRAQFLLCHNQGWELQAYCLQPALPAPEIGTVCSRVNEDTFWCGAGFQNLREFRILQAPTPTPTITPTFTPTPTPTSTSTPTITLTPTTPVSPTPTPTRPPRPGGSGSIEWLGMFVAYGLIVLLLSVLAYFLVGRKL